MTSIRKLFLVAAEIFVLFTPLQAFAPELAFQASRNGPTSLFYQNDNVDASVATSEPKTVGHAKSKRTIQRKKAIVMKIHSLYELQRFLEEDDRLVAIK